MPSAILPTVITANGVALSFGGSQGEKERMGKLYVTGLSKIFDNFQTAESPCLSIRKTMEPLLKGKARYS